MSDLDRDHTFRVPPEGNIIQPTVSAPVGHRGILAEVRAPIPRQLNPVLHPHQGSAARARSHEGSILPPDTSANAVVIPPSVRQGGTMSRGNVGGKSAKIEMITWMKNVKEVKKEGSSGPGSGADSGNGSRLSSRSRDESGGERAEGESGGRERRSDSRSKGGDEQKERDSQSLQTEYVVLLKKI